MSGSSTLIDLHIYGFEATEILKGSQPVSEVSTGCIAGIQNNQFYIDKQDLAIK